ncbi:MAG: pyroglutamyl-peptidase I [Planctomycetota bacterium]
MTRILLTAFEAYDRWNENSSWLALVDLTSWYDGDLQFTTRRYPVDLDRVLVQLEKDLEGNFDLAIHVGQSPGSSVVRLESVGLNLRANGEPLVGDGPMAYRSTVDLDCCLQKLTASGIPSQLSHHAGTYLCNATLYLSHHLCMQMGRPTHSLFMHLPLTPAQVARAQETMPSMSTPMQSAAVAVVADTLASRIH